MASQQARRENVTGERQVEVEKDRVPKMATHFESLAEKSKDEPLHGGHVETTVPVKVTAAVVTEKDEPRQQKMSGGSTQEETQRHSLEEISELRGRAQQNSAEAIRAAEERYQKAKNATETEKGEALQDTKQGPKDYTTAAMEKTQQAKDYAAQKAMEAKDVLAAKGQTAAQLASEKAKAAKQTAADASQVAAQKAMEAKDALAGKGQTAAQLAAEKAKTAKQTAADASQVAAEYVGEKAAVARDATVESGKGAAGYAKVAAGYVGEKAAVAKDATVESGKVAAGYAGKVASDVKDQAVVAGWGATHYTMEKVAEATKTVAGVTASVAGYTKDKVAGAGQTVGGFAAEKLAAAKDAVVVTEEKAADYAARKKMEAQRELEEKKLEHERVEGHGSFVSKDQHEEEMRLEMPSEKFDEYVSVGREETEKPKQASTGTGTGTDTVLQAIGETIVEIGQTTKDLLVGQSPDQGVGEKEKKGPYAGVGRSI